MSNKDTPTFKEWTDQYVADNIHKLKPQMVQDRKTGEFYNPQERFEERMNSPEVMAVLKRMKDR